MDIVIILREFRVSWFRGQSDWKGRESPGVTTEAVTFANHLFCINLGPAVTMKRYLQFLKMLLFTLFTDCEHIYIK